MLGYRLQVLSLDERSQNAEDDQDDKSKVRRDTEDLGSKEMDHGKSTSRS